MSISRDSLNETNGGTTQFNESITTSINPVVQNTFTGSVIQNQYYESFTAGGGTISVENSKATLSIGSGIGDYYVLRSKRVVKYRPGYVLVCRLGASFDSNAAGVNNSLLAVGLGSNSSDVYFAVQNGEFGFRYSTGGKSQVIELEIINSLTFASNDIFIELNGITYDITIIGTTTDTEYTAHLIEEGLLNQIPNFPYLIEHIASKLKFIKKDVGLANGNISFTSTGNVVSGTITNIKDGAPLTTTFTPLSRANGDQRFISKFDWTKKQMYSLDFSWYGVGNIIYSALDPEENKFRVLHTYRFANKSTDLNINQPNMYIQTVCASLGSSTPLFVTQGGSFAGVYGSTLSPYLPRFSVSNSKSISSNTETIILSLKLRYELNDYILNNEVFLNILSVSVDGNRPVTMKLYKNPTLLGDNTINDYHNYSYVNQSYSTMLYDQTVDTFTGGNLITEFTIGKDGNIIIDLSNQSLILERGDVFIFTATSTAVNTVDISLNWVEDI